MKFIKLLSSVIIVSASVGMVAAQKLSVKDKATEIDLFDPLKQVSSVTVVNNTSTSMSVKVSRIENILATGHETNFCWDVCYPANVSNSNGSVAIAGNGETNVFVGDFNSNGNGGTSSARYRFFNDKNAADSVSVQFVYDGTTGVKELAIFGSNKAVLLTPYPNPADGYTNVAYNVPASSKTATLQIYNAVGALIYKADIDEKQNEYRLYTANYANGIHFCTLTIDGKVIGGKRLVVDHK